MRYLLLLFLTISALAQTRSTVNVGTTANDGTGDTLRTFGTKVNTNFFQLWETVYTNGVAVRGGTNQLTTSWNLLGRTNTVDISLEDLRRFEATATDSTVTGIASLYLDGGTTTLRASTNLQFITPAVLGSTALLGDVLTVTDPTNGVVEFQSIGAALKIFVGDPALSVGTIADLIATTGNADYIVATKGYHTQGDGGHGLYRWTNALPAGVVTNTGTWFAGVGGFWGLVHDGQINAAQFGAVGVQVDQLPPYYAFNNFSTVIGTGDFTLAAEFRAPQWTEFNQGLMRIRSSGTLARLFQVSITDTRIAIDLMSTTATNNAASGGINDAGYWWANHAITPGTLNTLAVTRSGQTLTVYLNGVVVVGNYVNQQAFGEDICATSSSTFEAGVCWRPDWYLGELWFGDRILWSKIWGSVVSSAWSTAPGAIASTTMEETQLVDRSSVLQAALDALGANGGTLELPVGALRLDSGLTVPGGVSIVGTGGANYTQGRNPKDNIAGANSILFPWYGFRTNVLQFTAGTALQGGSPFLNAVTASDGSIYTSRQQNSTLENFAIEGSAMISGNGIYSTEAASWKAKNLTIKATAGHPIFVVAANAVEITDIDGIGRSGGFLFNFSADNDIGPNILWGSTRGAVLWFVNANKNRVKGNHIFNALQPRQNDLTVNTGTEEFTMASHGFITGDCIVFVPENGSTLPAPLDSRVHYWVTRTGPNTFTVNQQRDQGAIGGAMQGVALNITDTGTGAYWAYRGIPSNLLVHGSDQNQVVDNTLDQACQDAITLYNGDRSTIVGNMLTEYGYNDSSRTNGAAVRFLFGSTTNYVGGNMVGNRFTSSSFGLYGFIFGDGGSSGNIIDGQSMQPVAIPFLPSTGNNTISLDLRRQIYGDFIATDKALTTLDTTGWLVVPRIQGANISAPANVANFDGVYMGYNSTGTELRAYANSYWARTPFSAADGRWSFNNASSGIPTAQMVSAAANSTVILFNDSNTTGQGTSIEMRRARGTASARLAVTSGDHLAELQATGHNGTGNNFNAANIYMIANENFTTTAAGTRVVIQATPNGTTSPQDILSVSGTGVVANNSLRVGANGVSISRIRHGTVALTAGTVTVADVNVTATSRILLTSQTDGGTPGWLRVSARSVGVSFTITSSSGTDTSTVAWVIIEP